MSTNEIRKAIADIERFFDNGELNAAQAFSWIGDLYGCASTEAGFALINEALESYVEVFPELAE